MATLTQWTWDWASSGRWWTGKPGVPGVHGITKSWTWLSDWTSDWVTVTTNCNKRKVRSYENFWASQVRLSSVQFSRSVMSNSAMLRQMCIRSLSQEDPLKEGMTSHFNVLAWRILRTEEPGRLQSIGSHRFRDDWSDLAQMHRELLGFYIEKPNMHNISFSNTVTFIIWFDSDK